jgi:thiosulfate reductase cytochrome b subunit
MNPYWTKQVPLQGAWYIAGWLHFTLMLLVVLNVLGWGIVGLVALATRVISLF